MGRIYSSRSGPDPRRSAGQIFNFGLFPPQRRCILAPSREASLSPVAGWPAVWWGCLGSVSALGAGRPGRESLEKFFRAVFSANLPPQAGLQYRCGGPAPTGRDVRRPRGAPCKLRVGSALGAGRPGGKSLENFFPSRFFPNLPPQAGFHRRSGDPASRVESSTPSGRAFGEGPVSALGAGRPGRESLDKFS